MAKKPETRFKDILRPKLLAIPKSWWVKTQFMALIGIPDWLGCVAGQFVALEMKKDAASRVAVIQRHVMHKIVEAGGYALVVSPENCDTVLDILRKISSGETWK